MASEVPLQPDAASKAVSKSREKGPATQQPLEVCQIGSGNVLELLENSHLLLESTTDAGRLQCQLEYAANADSEVLIKPLTDGCFVNGSLAACIRENREFRSYPIAPGSVVGLGQKRFQLRFRSSTSGQRRLPATPGQQTKTTLPRKRTRRHKAVKALSEQRSAPPATIAEAKVKDSGNVALEMKPMSSLITGDDNDDDDCKMAVTTPAESKPVERRQLRRLNSSGSLGGWVVDIFSIMVWDPEGAEEEREKHADHATEEASSDVADQVSEVISHQLIVANPATAATLIDRVFRAVEDAADMCEESLKTFLDSWDADVDSVANMTSLLDLIETLLSYPLEELDTWLATLLLLQARFTEVPGVSISRTMVGLVVGFLLTNSNNNTVFRLACKLLQEWSLQEVHIPSGTGDILCAVLRSHYANPDTAASICELLVTLASAYPDVDASQDGAYKQTQPILEELMKSHAKHSKLQKWGKQWLARFEKKKRDKKKKKVAGSDSSDSLASLQSTLSTATAGGNSSPKGIEDCRQTAPARVAQPAAKGRRSLPQVPPKKDNGAADAADQSDLATVSTEAVKTDTTAIERSIEEQHPVVESAQQTSVDATTATCTQIQHKHEPKAAAEDIQSKSAPAAEGDQEHKSNRDKPTGGSAGDVETQTSSKDPSPDVRSVSAGGEHLEASKSDAGVSEVETAPKTDMQTMFSGVDQTASGHTSAEDKLSLPTTTVQPEPVDESKQVTTAESILPAADSNEPVVTEVDNADSKAETCAPTSQTGGEVELERQPKPDVVTITVDDTCKTNADKESQNDKERTEDNNFDEQSQLESGDRAADEGLSTPTEGRSRSRSRWGSPSPSATSPLSPISPLSPLLLTLPKTGAHDEEEADIQIVQNEHEDVAGCLSKRTMGVRLAKQRWEEGQLLLALRTAFQLEADADVAGYLDVLSMLLKQIYRWPHEILAEAMNSLGGLNLSTLSPRHVELSCSLMTVLTERLLLPPPDDSTVSLAEEFFECLSTALESTEEFISCRAEAPLEESEWRKAWMSVRTLNQRLNLGIPKDSSSG